MGIYVFNANVLREVLHEMETKKIKNHDFGQHVICLLYTSDAADERSSVDLGGRRIIKKKKIWYISEQTTII